MSLDLETRTKLPMTRNNGLRARGGKLLSWFLDVGRDFCSSLFPSPSANEDGRSRGFMANALGWPPPKLNARRGEPTQWLNGLRGLAAFLVMSYHFHIAWWGMGMEVPYGAFKDQPWDIWRLPVLRILVCSGHTQVSIFFVLSGFVLSWSPLGHIRSKRDERVLRSLSSAVFRRWFRLFVPCFMVGFFSLLEFWVGVLDLVVERKSTFIAQFWDYILASERFANPFKLERYGFETGHEYNWTMWTIPNEFAGSIEVFALLLATCRIHSYGRRTLVVFTVALYGFVGAHWYYWLFASGMLLADYVRQTGGFEELSHNMRPWSFLAWFTILILGLLLAGVPESNTVYPRPGYEWMDAFIPSNYVKHEGGIRFWWCWAGILIITSACHLAFLRRFFQLSLCRYLGRISFMLYLTHRSVQECIGVFLRRYLQMLLGQHVWSDTHEDYIYKVHPTASSLIYVVSWLVLGSTAIFVAHWCEVLIDAPSTRFSRWLDVRFINGLAKRPNEEPESELSLLPT